MRNHHEQEPVINYGEDNDTDKDVEAHLTKVQSLCTFANKVPKIDTKDAVISEHTFPDGGMEAWSQVFGGFLVAMNTWYGPVPGFRRSTDKMLILVKGLDKYVGHIPNLLLLATT